MSLLMTWTAKIVTVAALFSAPIMLAESTVSAAPAIHVTDDSTWT